MEAVLATTLEAYDPNRDRVQAEDDVITQFSELVDGQMRTKFELSFDGHDLYGQDGRSMTEVTQKSLEEAKQLVKENPNLWFELRRRRLEDEERQILLNMAKGETPNTMVVVSDFPAELMDAKEDVGGYNVTRQQTMLRIMTRQPDGSIRMVSQSLDKSDRKSLEAIYEYFGQAAEPGELLGRRIQVDLAPDGQENLADRLTGIYDRTMTDQYDGSWYAGRRPADYRNTYDFVCGQNDLVGACIELKLSNKLTDEIMYDMAALMNERFAKYGHSQEKANSISQEDITFLIPRSGVIDYLPLQRQLELAGSRARSQGKSFSACGGTLKAEGSGSLEEQLGLAGYGNKADEETSWHGGKVYKNSKCVSCEKVKDEVGACHICKDCVNSPKKHK